MSDETWILGGTGRSGRAVALELAKRGRAAVLVGRDAGRLAEAAAQVDATRVVACDSLRAMAAAIRAQAPAVVVNTVGPFTTTAGPIAEACLTAGSHYLDLANDIAAVSRLLALDTRAAAAGLSLVTGAGFGVTATESVVVRLCTDRSAAASVRVDMVPSLAIEAGVVGAALASTLLDGLPGVPGGGRYSGRRFAGGRLVRSRVGGDVAHLTLPDGSAVPTAGIPLGELLAAQRASSAPDVVAASSEAPSGRVVTTLLPLALGLLRIAPLRALAKQRLAAVRLRAKPRPREHSWGHAVVTWADGTVREGWLRVGEAQAFTGAVPAEVAHRLLAGEGRPGAFTPAALFGSALATSCGAVHLAADGAPVAV